MVNPSPLLCGCSVLYTPCCICSMVYCCCRHSHIEIHSLLNVCTALVTTAPNSHLNCLSTKSKLLPSTVLTNPTANYVNSHVRNLCSLQLALWGTILICMRWRKVCHSFWRTSIWWLAAALYTPLREWATSVCTFTSMYICILYRTKGSLLMRVQCIIPTGAKTPNAKY